MRGEPLIEFYRFRNDCKASGYILWDWGKGAEPLYGVFKDGLEIGSFGIAGGRLQVTISEVKDYSGNDLFKASYYREQFMEIADARHLIEYSMEPMTLNKGNL